MDFNVLFTMGLPDKLDLIAEPVISPDVGVGQGVSASYL